MRVMAYGAARLGLFFALAGVLYLIGWWDIIALVAALVLSWLIGYLALPGMRLRAAQQMDGWIERSQRGHREADAAEDAEIGPPSGS